MKRAKAGRSAAATGRREDSGYSIPSSQISTGGATLSLLRQSHAPPCRLATVKPREKVLPLSTSNLRLRPTEGSLLCSRLSICFILTAFCKWLHIPHVGKHVHALPLPPAQPVYVQVLQPVHSSPKTTLGTISVVTKSALGMQVNSALQSHPYFSSKKGTKIARKKAKSLGWVFVCLFVFFLIHSQ